MKTPVLIVFCLLLSFGSLFSQPEKNTGINPKCGCGKWKGIEVSISGNTGTPPANVKCGGSIQLPAVGVYQITTSDFICNPPQCIASYNWQVSGPVNGTGTGKPFSFTFSLPGTYTVIVTPICGNQKCEPCKFEVVIKDDCKCGKWKGIEVLISGDAAHPGANVKCGGTVQLGSTGTYQIATTDFICVPANCNASYVWQVTGPVSGNGTGKPFSFNFSQPGTYNVTVTPICGNQRCEPCRFIIIIKGGGDCKCGKWNGIEVHIYTNAATPPVNVKCGGDIALGGIGNYQIQAPDFICVPAPCQATYKWEVFGPVNGNGTGKPFSFNFSSPGNYTVLITPVCGNTPCEPCKFAVTVKK